MHAQGHCQGTSCGSLYPAMIGMALRLAPADASGILAVGNFSAGSVSASVPRLVYIAPCQETSTPSYIFMMIRPGCCSHPLQPSTPKAAGLLAFFMLWDVWGGIVLRNIGDFVVQRLGGEFGVCLSWRMSEKQVRRRACGAMGRWDD
jgi:hypothetical protein